MFLYQDFSGVWQVTMLQPPVTSMGFVTKGDLPSILQALQAAFGTEAVQQAWSPTPPSGAYEETHP